MTDLTRSGGKDPVRYAVEGVLVFPVEDVVRYGTGGLRCVVFLHDF